MIDEHISGSHNQLIEGCQLPISRVFTAEFIEGVYIILQHGIDQYTKVECTQGTHRSPFLLLKTLTAARNIQTSQKLVGP